MEIVCRQRHRDRKWAPVSIAVDGSPFALRSADEKLFVQKDGENLVFLPPFLGRDTETVFTTEPCKEAPPVVALKATGDAVDFFVNETLFTSYHFGAHTARPYFNPVIGPGGASMVRDVLPNRQAGDHIHHRGIWTGHGDINGYDNWSEDPGHIRTVHREFLELTSGPVFGRMRCRSEWVSAQGEVVLEEDRTVTVYATPQECRLVDHLLVLRATSGPAVFKDTKESGMLSVRVAPSMNGTAGGTIHLSDGSTGEAESWGRRAAWCDYAGVVNGTTAGICVMDHPSNFRAPAWWHVRDYGLMAAAYFGISEFTGDPKRSGTFHLEKGRELRFLHRVFIHAGPAEEAGVAEQYLNFIHPATVTVRR